MVSVEFSAEENEVVGKVYDAESRLKYASEPRGAHLAGSVRSTVSRLLMQPWEFHIDGCLGHSVFDYFSQRFVHSLIALTRASGAA